MNQTEIKEKLASRGASPQLINGAEPIIDFIAENLIDLEPSFCTMNNEHQISFDAPESFCLTECLTGDKSACNYKVHHKTLTFGLQEENIQGHYIAINRVKGTHCLFETRMVMYPGETDLKSFFDWFNSEKL